jgi:flagellar motility protein MotE (MotC chaperone)
MKKIRHCRSKGFSFFPVLCLIGGLLLGLAGGLLAPRYLKVDMPKWLKPAEPSKTAKSGFLSPRDEEWNRLINEVKDSKDDLLKREKLVTEREKLADEKEKLLLRLKEEVAQTESQTEKFIKKYNEDYSYDTVEFKNIKQLEKDFIEMEPSAAAPLLANLGDALAVKVLQLMPPEQVGLILTEMAKLDKGADKAVEYCQKLKKLKPYTPPQEENQ